MLLEFYKPPPVALQPHSSPVASPPGSTDATVTPPPRTPAAIEKQWNIDDDTMLVNQAPACLITRLNNSSFQELHKQGCIKQAGMLLFDIRTPAMAVCPFT